MKRKSLILLIALVVLSFSTISFAADTANNIKNTINGATNSVVDGAQNLADDVRSGIGTAENSIENTVEDIGNAVSDGANYAEDAGTDAYTTTRSVAEDVTNGGGMTVSTWTWIAVAIAGIVIVALVWYYASQNNYKH